jgi:hypothetical protein
VITGGLQLLVAAEQFLIDIGDFFDYCWALIETVVGAQDNQHLHSDDWQRTIYIDTLGVGTTDFALSDDRKEALVVSGRDHAREYFAWWEEQDRPAFKIISAETLQEIAEKRTRNLSELTSIKGMTPGQIQRYGDRIVVAVAAGMALPEEELPRLGNIKLRIDRLDADEEPVAHRQREGGGHHRGADQLVYAIEDIRRGCDLGVRGVLVADIGLLQVVREMKRADDAAACYHRALAIQPEHAGLDVFPFPRDFERRFDAIDIDTCPFFRDGCCGCRPTRRPPPADSPASMSCRPCPPMIPA